MRCDRNPRYHELVSYLRNWKVQDEEFWPLAETDNGDLVEVSGGQLDTAIEGAQDLLDDVRAYCLR